MKENQKIYVNAYLKKEKRKKTAYKFEFKEIQEQLYPEFAKYRLIEHRHEFQNYSLETFLGIFLHQGAHLKHILTFLMFLRKSILSENRS